VAPIFRILAFQVAFGGFECFLTRDGLASSTLALVAITFENFAVSICFKSILTNYLGSVS
jgi:hypothetical protein